jgi:indole-3-glycerol phosphate synthase
LIDTVPDILARIVARKRKELAEAAIPRAEWEALAARNSSTRRDFRAALEAARPAIIAEIKRASPSKGLLASGFDPKRLAQDYERGGAAAISVLTDRDFFQGSLTHLEAAREVVSLPVLREDFTISEVHILEAAAHGADAILLIAAILEEGEMRRLRELAAEYGMAALVEVHNRRELDSAVASGAEIIGVNNRDLTTFQVTLETSLELAPHIPSGALKVAESGIVSSADIARLAEAGFTAFLVGEHLMKSGDAAGALRALRGVA